MGNLAWFVHIYALSIYLFISVFIIMTFYNSLTLQGKPNYLRNKIYYYYLVLANLAFWIFNLCPVVQKL